MIEKITYSYDAKGQRLSRTTLNNYPEAKETLIQASYDNANRLTQLKLKGTGANNSDETFNLTYDANGNLIKKEGVGSALGKITIYTWDAKNQLIDINQQGTINSSVEPLTASFAYDTFGRRANKTINNTTVNYIYDGDQAVAEEANGATTSQLTGLSIDEHIARYNNQTQTTYLTDALGSIIVDSGRIGEADYTLNSGIS